MSTARRDVRVIDTPVTGGEDRAVPRVEPEYRTLGETVRRLRRERDMSQERLAADIGLSRSALANMEAGQQRIAFHHFLSLARALRVDPAQMLPQPAPDDELPVDEQLVGLGVPEPAAQAVARAVRTVINDATRPPHRTRRTSRREAP